MWCVTMRPIAVRLVASVFPDGRASIAPQNSTTPATMKRRTSTVATETVLQAEYANATAAGHVLPMARVPMTYAAESRVKMAARAPTENVTARPIITAMTVQIPSVKISTAVPTVCVIA